MEEWGRDGILMDLVLDMQHNEHSVSSRIFMNELEF